MTLPSNVHTHSTWCDGKNTTREVAEEALRLGLTGLGFSSHSPAPFDPTCPGVQDEAAYRAEIAALKEEYAGRLDILCGMETDYYAQVDHAQYDYIIGSVHYMPVQDGQYNAADGDKETILTAKQRWYNGDGLAMARDFYALSVENARRFKADIVGHFDVLAKQNAKGELFDEDSPAYQSIALEALDETARIVAPYGGMFEVNTGGMSRGFRDTPYPAAFMLRHLAQIGARVIITSDSHAAETLVAGMQDTVPLLQASGFTSMVVMQGGRFVDVKL